MLVKKKLVAGIVTCALGAIAVGIVWATPGSGITTTIISGPVILGDAKVKSKTEINKVEIATEGFSDVYVVHNKIAPGGQTGWHSHAGPSIISVKSGQVAEEHADGTVHIHNEGTSFLEPAGQVHNMRNLGTTDLELVAVQILPLGTTRRIDEPAP